MKKKIKRILVYFGALLVVLVLIALSLLLGYELGHEDGLWHQQAQIDEHLRRFIALDRRLSREHSDTRGDHTLAPGRDNLVTYLPSHSPSGASTQKVVVSGSNNQLKIRTESIEPVRLTLRGDVVSWDWDLGYSGSEVFVGRVVNDVVIGNFYSPSTSGASTVGKWVLKPETSN